MGFVDFCSTLVAKLPDPALPILPSLLLGITFASIILLYLYKKETNLPLNDILLHMSRRLFISISADEYPTGHSVTEQCNSSDCVKSQRYSELKQKIVERWNRWRRGRADLGLLRRVEEAVMRLVEEGKVKEENREILGDNRDGREKEKAGNLKGEREGKVNYRGKTGRIEGKTNSPKKSEKEEGEKWELLQKRKMHQNLQRPTVFHMDLSANPDWTNLDVHVGDQNLLKLNFNLITREFESVFEALKSGDASGWKKNNIQHGHWCIFPFVNQGKIIASNCRRCPGVAELILGCLPAVMNDCVFGNVAFSILYPDSHIMPHNGPTTLRLRCHLGLKVPPGCWLEVAGEQHQWSTKETLIFDDSFTHTLHFASQPNSVQSEPKAVLLLDFWHPDVSAKEKECLLELLAPLDGA